MWVDGKDLKMRREVNLAYTVSLFSFFLFLLFLFLFHFSFKLLKSKSIYQNSISYA
jgi:hypothetical protein